jgi:hypothetical protein
MTKPVKGARMNPLARKQKILEAAIQIAIVSGYRNITRKEVSLLSGSASGLIGRYFNTVENLKKEVLKEAIKHEIMPILIENLSAREFDKIEISTELKQKIISYLNT